MYNRVPSSYVQFSMAVLFNERNHIAINSQCLTISVSVRMAASHIRQVHCSSYSVLEISIQCVMDKKFYRPEMNKRGSHEAYT